MFKCKFGVFWAHILEERTGYAVQNNRDYYLHYIPHSGLFSLGANFPEFPEWARDSGKFMLGCL